MGRQRAVAVDITTVGHVGNARNALLRAGTADAETRQVKTPSPGCPRGQCGSHRWRQKSFDQTLEDSREAVSFLLAHLCLYDKMGGVSAANTQHAKGGWAEKQRTEQRQRKHQCL